MLLTLDKFCSNGADAIIFTSSSTALSFVEQEEDLKLKRRSLQAVTLQFWS